MTMRCQKSKCRLERTGVKHARTVLNCHHRNSFKSPFDLVSNGIGYEVKTLSANSRDLKIHISDSSYQRKVDYAQSHGLKVILMAVLIGESVTVYQSELRQSIRINQMQKIGG